MDLTEIKIFALHYIKDDEFLSDEEKIKFMEFVEKSNEDEILFLLTTGQMPGDEILTIEGSGDQAYRMEFVDPGTVEAGVQVAKAGAIGLKALVAGGKIGYHAAKTIQSLKGDPTSKFARFDKYGGMATSTMSSMAASFALKVRKTQIQKMMNKCDKERGMAKRVCYNKVTRDAMRKEITSLSLSRNRCEVTNNPDKCIKDINDRIKTIQKKMDSIKVF